MADNAKLEAARMKGVDPRVLRKKRLGTFLRYLLLILVGIVMIYPLLWMVGASFKPNNEVFATMNIIPTHPTAEGYKMAMESYGGDINIWKSILNTFRIVVPKVIFTIISSVMTAYGFGRFHFKGRDLLYSILISTLFLPQVVLNVPQYMLYNKLGWINSQVYLPLIVPSLFACDTYFVFMLVQFLHGVPKELEEASRIDGCNVVQTLTKIVVPMLMPAIVSCALFQFMWTSNDFMGPLLYVTTPSNYPATLFVKLSMDSEAGFSWNKVLATSLISMVPSITLFFLAQNQFVEGISAGGVKG